VFGRTSARVRYRHRGPCRNENLLVFRLWSRSRVSFYTFHVPWCIRKGRAEEILELVFRDAERAPEEVLHDVPDISSANMDEVAAEFDLGIFKQGRPNLTKGFWDLV
jgi:hypothetical protein